MDTLSLIDHAIQLNRDAASVAYIEEDYERLAVLNDAWGNLVQAQERETGIPFAPYRMT